MNTEWNGKLVWDTHCDNKIIYVAETVCHHHQGRKSNYISMLHVAHESVHN